MANPFVNFLSALSPPPVTLDLDYDGLEYRWKIFTIRPGLFKNELFVLLAVIAYFGFYFIGKKLNEKRVNSWVDLHLPFYGSQFSSPLQTGGLTQDGSSDFFAFSTGRRAITSLHTTFTLRPRHDLFQYAYQVIWGLVELNYKAADEIELDFTLKDGAGVPDCVWAVVAKDELRNIKEKRWDLTFAKTSENSALPPSLSVMSEFADITETLFKPHGPLSVPSVLSNPAILPYFRSLTLTDQPRSRPAYPIPPNERTKHLILSLTLPSASQAAVTLPLVQSIFNLIDVISAEGGWGVGKGPQSGKSGVGLNASLRPETRMKLKKVREDVDKELIEEATKEKKEEAAEEKAAAKKKAEEERLSKLSATEQKKALEREKKRALRRTQGKVRAR
ncbi:hypothetical protein NLI96_g5580 [Meripilus lineatus]|uniref:DUF1682-domain-containing protein n=1 Tax=Meripilus lineatus TaxID=2056292 RepID=A0AAD5V4L3_9APHY|nr:hypothetical protein NLI96_g5580 [Physisporinus lineatus]